MRQTAGTRNIQRLSCPCGSNLKSAPTVVRQRVGIDFRLLSDRIQVIDLIPRQDLELRIKTLK